MKRHVAVAIPAKGKAGWIANCPGRLTALDPDNKIEHLPHRARLALLRCYRNALDYLHALKLPDEPWPQHFYEGGASIARTND